MLYENKFMQLYIKQKCENKFLILLAFKSSVIHVFVAGNRHLFSKVPAVVS